MSLPVEFVLFAATLVGVALLHSRSLEVAACGLGAVLVYKLAFTGFHGVSGLGGLLHHLAAEWVILANLLCLLLGFALLSRHFEQSRVPDRIPELLPDDWRGGLVLLVFVFVLSSFLDNIAAALIGGTVAASVYRHKVHIGYIAALVAASNAGGSGSVVGDTTTTMMWIDGVSPRDVFHAYVAAATALLVFGIPAAIQQQRYSPIMAHAESSLPVDWPRVAVVLLVLVAAVATNVLMNVGFPELAQQFPFIGVAVWVALLAAARWRAPDWQVLPGALRGTRLPAVPRIRRVADAGRGASAGLLADGVWPRLRVGRVRQHSAHEARARTGRP